MNQNSHASALDETPESVFCKVGECPYRHKSSGTYYGLGKRSGKQFRQSLKTTDFKLAKRRLRAFRDKVGRLSQTQGASKMTFEELPDRWLATVRGNMDPSSARRRSVDPPTETPLCRQSHHHRP